MSKQTTLKSLLIQFLSDKEMSMPIVAVSLTNVSPIQISDDGTHYIELNELED